MKKNNDSTNEKDEEDNVAAEALMKMITLDRSAPQENLQELVSSVIQSEKYRQYLPVLICYMRNHNKSQGPGTGMGERDLAERLTIALFDVDKDAGVLMLRFLVAYGGWKSLLRVLTYCDSLMNCVEVKEAVPKVSKRSVSGNRSPKKKCCRNRSNKDRSSRKSSANEGPYKDLVNSIHQMFAKQLKTDSKAVEDTANKEGELAVVSNASKYAPHEKRGQGLTKDHGDAIASHLFPDNLSNENKKYNKRRLYRQLRSRLNEANRHLPDRYLSLGRAGELHMSQITAGYLSKSRKALLNLPNNEHAAKKMRYDDPGRIQLRERVLRAMNDPKRVPAPSDIAELARSLFDLSQSDEPDDGEKIVLESTYLKAVMVLAEYIKERRTKITRLLKALSIKEDDALTAPSKVLVAIDVSPSQSHTFLFVALVTLLLNDALEMLKENEMKEDNEEKPNARSCILFHQRAEVHPLPISRSSPISERLGALVKEFRSACLTTDGVNENDYTGLMQLINREVAENKQTVSIVCSDFVSSEAFAKAVEDTSTVELCCWKMSKPARLREREISWDPRNPKIDLCIVLDTTGSMGGQIESCKTQIHGLLSKLGEGSGMPVSCSFVSYKDFGDPGHLEVHPWTDARAPRQMQVLREFIGRLSASGGMDIEEDVAGGFEKALDLFRDRLSPSLKMLLWIADAGGHGYPSGRPKHKGVDQKERLRTVVQKLSALPHNGGIGCELLLANITSGTDLTCEAIDSWLVPERTFVDQINMGYVSGAVFRDKILSTLQQVVSHAVAPPTTKGVDIIAGTDLATCQALLSSRLSNYYAALVEESKEEETATGIEDIKDNAIESDETKDGALEASSAIENLLGKLMVDDYTLVRQAMGVLKEGLYASYEPPSDQSLSKASIVSLLQAGVSVDDLKEEGYPEYIITLFVDLVKEQIRHGSGKPR